VHELPHRAGAAALRPLVRRLDVHGDDVAHAQVLAGARRSA
jgi:hypothetical protein